MSERATAALPVARRRGSLAAASAVLVVIALLGALAPWLAPYDPTAIPDAVGMRSLPPSAAHPFGTDVFSRDVLSRVIWGTRVSLEISVLAVLLAVLVGTSYGAIAGYAGGRTDAVLMRLNDAFLAIPRILLLLGILALWGTLPVGGLVLLLGLTGWFGVSRLVRAEVRSLATREWVDAARALGVAHRRIVWRHILPHVAAPVLIAATFGVANVIVLEAGLSYLGFGVQPPRASWGSIIHDGSDAVTQQWWVSVFPGIALVATSLALHVVADGLRERLNPRQLPAP